MKKIPIEVETYKEGSLGADRQTLSEEKQVLELVKGEPINIRYWVRFPSYDYIFGTPHKDSWRYKKEFAVFVKRRRNEDMSMSVTLEYLDQTELEEMQKGFTKLMDVSHVERLKEWAERNAAKNVKT